MDYNNQQDEIRIEDILRVLWKWRFFIIGITILTVLISVYVSFSKKPIYVISGSVTRTVWDNKYSDKNIIELYIRSYSNFEKLLKDKDIMVFLKKQSDKHKTEEIYNWYFDNYKFYLTDISDIIELKIKFWNKKYLKRIANFYINEIYNYEKKIYDECMNKGNKLKNISTVGISPAIIINPMENVIVREKSNKLKLIITTFIVSLITTIFLSFIFNYISKINWDEIKK